MLPSPFRRSIPLAVLALAAACQLGPTRSGSGNDPAEHAAVALLLDGSALRETAAREAVTTIATERMGSPVRVLAGEPTASGVLQPIAKRSARERGDYDWREPACAKRARPLVPALAGAANVVLRVRLDAKTTTRPATDADRKVLGNGMGRALAAVGIGADAVVVDTRIDGFVERTTFPGSPKTTREKVKWTGKRLAKEGGLAAEDVRTATAAALGRMPAAPAPRFDALSRTLAANDCPFLAYAVATTLVTDPGAQRKLASAAGSAMHRTATSQKPEQVADAAPTPVDIMPSGPEPDEPAPTDTTPAYSCSTLCSLHMVELCNGDRTLWSQHGTRWESSRCGVRRPESFLAECYRMQWLSGTYERSCVKPCEEVPDGKLRLEAMLRRAGCLRAGS